MSKPVVAPFSKHPAHRFSVAPMMDWTNSECRMFHRQLSRNALLYTEMVTTGAILHGKDPHRFLDYQEAEHPIALQLGGCNPKDIALCAQQAQKWQYDEVNLNVGCPSDRVQNGMIGAILMAHSDKVSDAVKAMQDQTHLNVTVKHRIGIDDYDSYDFVRDFIGNIHQAGCETFIVHARKAILQGLSPKENREIPPLNYERVYKLKQDFPNLNIIINGGIKTMEECHEHLTKVDGVMLGREAYQNPSILRDVDRVIFEDEHQISKRQAVLNMVSYLNNHPHKEVKYVTRHLLGLYQGIKGAKQFRRHLSENAPKAGNNTQLIHEALDMVDPA